MLPPFAVKRLTFLAAIKRSLRREGRLKNAGFTLIELLVVISIIAILSSIVLASLKNARTQANAAAVKEELVQLRTLYETLATNGSYAALQPAGSPTAWSLCQTYSSGNTGYICQMFNAMQCSLVFAHDTLTNSSNAVSLCANIVQNTGLLEIGVMNNTNLNQHYSIVSFLPGINQYLCLGSSGGNSTFTTTGNLPPSTVSGETGIGCPGNP